MICRSENCSESAVFSVTNGATEDDIAVCKDCLEELLSRTRYLQIDRL